MLSSQFPKYSSEIAEYEYDYDTVSILIDKLIHSAQEGKTFPTVQIMKEIVPEYKSKNSVYEQLDK